MSSGEVLLTVKEYAYLFRKKPQTVYKRIERSQFTRFPLERDGRSILIRVPADMVVTLENGRRLRTA